MFSILKTYMKQINGSSFADNLGLTVDTLLVIWYYMSVLYKAYLSKCRIIFGLFSVS
jgi:hypothetical protein